MTDASGAHLQVKPEPFLERLNNPPPLDIDPTIPTPSESVTAKLPSMAGILEGAAPEASAAKDETVIDTTKPPEEVNRERTIHEQSQAGIPKEVEDIGWNDHPDAVPSPIAKGLSNDDLWILLRRFNKASHCTRISSNIRVMVKQAADISR
jgi:hypothetical protein